MTANCIAEIRALLDGTMPEPSTTLMFYGIHISTDWDRRQQDAAFYRQARGIVIELLDEIDQTHCANRLLTASVSHLQDEVSRLRQTYATLHVASVIPSDGSVTAHVTLEYMDG